MLRCVLPMVVAAVCLMIAGCQQESTPDGSPAEVPQPGPAALEDPGPAPEGQTEPPVDDTTLDAPQATEEGSAAPVDEPANNPPPGDGDVSLLMQNWDETNKLIAGHQGKVVVVDFWSTSCLPCRREFPHLVALQKAHPDEVACVSVSLDYTGRKSRPPESYRESVLGFLTEQNATIDNVLSTDDPDELEQRLELAPIPLVWVLDRAGERVRVFDNSELEGEEFTYQADVVPFVESLVAESPDGQNKAADSADISVR